MAGYEIRSTNVVKAITSIKVVSTHLDLPITDFTVDSRKVQRANSLFAAISLRADAPRSDSVWYKLSEPSGGYYFNHHQYIDDAIEAGATLVICEVLPQNLHDYVLYIQVANVIEGLRELSRFVIDQSSTTIVAVTGSSGKTTTVNMIYQVLKGNLNNVAKVYTYRPNPISMSLGILNAYSEIEEGGVLVVEMPTDHYGCISRLASIAVPDIGVVLNVKDAHVNVFGNVEGIAVAKKELVDSIAVGGTAVLNMDDRYVSKMLDTNSSGLRRVGFSVFLDNVELVASSLSVEADGIQFTLHKGENVAVVTLPLLGHESVYNGLAAASVALALDIHTT